MKVKVTELIELFKKYHQSIKIHFFDNITIGNNNYIQKDLVLPEHLATLSKENIDEITVFYNAQMYDYLNKEFPSQYPKAYGQMEFMEIDRSLEELEKINFSSERKRILIHIGDLYITDNNTGKNKIILHHNEKLDYKKWNILKREINRKHKFLYRHSECAIIIFIDLSQNADVAYIKKFKKNIDLISLMVSEHKSQSRFIAPDFVPSSDVISVTDPNILLDEYINNNARLIIIGEQLDVSYKKALLRVKQYDKWVRLLAVPELDHSNTDHFFKQVKLVYNANRWSK